MMLDITFLYFEECPSHDVALDRLRQVLKEESIEAEVDIIKIETEEQAQAYAFPGSPTIRVNGEDIVAPFKDAVDGLTCRVYKLEDGRISPLPSLKMIREGLHK